MEYLLWVIKGSKKPWGIYCARQRQITPVISVTADCPATTITDIKGFLKGKYGYTDHEVGNTPNFAVLLCGELELKDGVATITRPKVKFL